MNSRISVLLVLISLILFGVVIFDQFRINKLNSIIDKVDILSYQGDSLLVYSPRLLEESTLLITPDFVDMLTDYKSPFWDGGEGEDRSFQSLINEYVRNRNQDHYGAKRGDSRIRRIHEGIDLFVPENTPVYPIGEYGVVIQVSDNPNHLEWVDCTNEHGQPDSIQVEYGKLVKVLYPEGITSTYVHLNEIYVTVGEIVNGDTKLGLTGVTGNLKRSGKPSHLHMEIRYTDGSSFDPRHRLHYKGSEFGRFIRLLTM